LSFTCRYIALYVPDLEAAETFYRGVFDMNLLFRESEQEGEWYALRPELDWAAAGQQSVQVDMVALERDGFVLALFRGDPRPGTMYEVCLGVDAGEVDVVRTRLPPGVDVEEARTGWLRFMDPFGFRWAVRNDTAPFRSSGELANRWIG
jgi:catechol 2,3-dioxygenase-like lactoylglutathione lyase family enzyme